MEEFMSQIPPAKQSLNGVAADSQDEKPVMKVPHTYVIIFCLMIIASILTYIIPGGEFVRIEKNYEGVGKREVVVPGSYKAVDRVPQGPWNTMNAVMKGLKHHSATDIVFFILLIGGAFGIITETGAVEAALGRLVKACQNREIFVIPAVMLAFSIGGASFGMCEETIPFVAMVVPLSLKLGYDSITGVAMVYVGAMIGFATAFLNPFTVGIAQGIAQIKPFSGMGYRLGLWIFFTLFTIGWVMRYASRIKANPDLSPVRDLDLIKLNEYARIAAHEEAANEEAANEEAVNGDATDQKVSSHVHKLKWSQKGVLLIIAVGFAAIIYGAIRLGWYIDEMVAIFLTMGILCGLISRLPLNSIAESFGRGCSDIANAAILVGFARAVLVLLADGKAMDTILHHVSGMVGDLPAVVSVQCMYLFQTLANFFVPSGSGQAALTMPIMAPLADAVGITRQTAVLAYQFGDGFTNMIIPTSAVTMAVLGMAGVPWERWAKWMLPLTIVYFLLGALALIPPVLMGWQG
ncbi:MAG: hypothetical protein CVV64_15155 [Candidatus Wallbacteria bacterium HGW-Wallbacteria-1]|uniref:Basic amino acid antiporter YfcC n=1 Tax=Candidatus Wallbacteria bacterium HGW-Wallbacteria-1 TaxID=2013854 RepID=A0A2N1PLN5_9BACT|nr:MAG: hypothetical protein CVV64_15155 [Candidatus Wallbacteria bacterium HGW-Wallbacteria-1]